MPKLLLIGWDAADWKVIRPLLAAGKMPHLAALMAEGVSGNIATLYPALSPTLWTSIATGKRPFRHGIHGFTEPTDDGLRVRPITTLGRKTKAVWNILNQNGKRPVVVGWWPSHPAEPIDGIMVSNHFAPGRGDGPDARIPPECIWPPDARERFGDLRVHGTDVPGEILRLFIPELEKIDQEKDPALHDLAAIVAETMSVHNAATEAIAGGNWDFAAVYYVGIDHFSHRFMRRHAGKRPKRESGNADLLRDVVRNAYQYHDVMLGRLLALAGPGTSVLLTSDHGFHSDHLLPEYMPAEAAAPAIEHRHFGIVCLRAPGVKRGATIHGASILDITPTVLHLFGLPAGQDMDGKVLSAAFDQPAVAPRIPSWDSVPGKDGQRPQDRSYDGGESVESLNQLVALGYVSPPDADGAKAVQNCLKENRYNVARAYLDGGQTSAAAEVFESLLAADPEDSRFYAALFHCHLQLADRLSARQLLTRFDQVCAAMAPRARAELERRSEELKGNDAPPAVSFELRQLAEKATGFLMQRMLMRCRLELSDVRTVKRKQAAAGALEQFASAVGRRLVGAQFLAEGFLAAGDSARAMQYVRRMKRADPDDWTAMGLEARIRFSEKRYEEAVGAAAESLLRVYFQPDLHLLLALALWQLEEPERAEEEARVALAQSPNLALAHELLGKILKRDRARIGESSLHLAKAETLRREQGKRKPAAASPAPAAPAGLPAVGDWDGNEPADRSKLITVVTGLPRSGTSMMMQMLAAAGIRPYTDGLRAPDDDNPRGYLEHEQATRLHRDASWVPEARGKAVKIVAQLLPHLPAGEEYRIVFMRRKPEDVIASQAAMLERLGREGSKLSADELRRVYTRQLVQVQQWMQRTPGVQVLALSYEAALEDARETARRLARFLGSPFDEGAAANAVAPSLRRQGSAVPV